MALPGAFAMVAPFACAPRPRMCVASGECRAADTCVAGRCQPVDGGTPAIAEVTDAGYVVRRLVVAPVDIAWVRRSGPVRGTPSVFALGRESDGDSMLFARFALALPREARIVEAYLLLARSDAVDQDPGPIALHAVRVVEPWDGGAIAWSALPRTEEVRAPTTRVALAGGALVRLDVRAIVERWALHDRRDQGMAVVAENSTPSGVPFVLVPSDPAGGASASVAAQERAPAAEAPELAAASLASPRLELYVR